MAKSIIQADTEHCFLCGRNGSMDRLEEHHVYPAANRNNSDKYGLVVYLCGERCHRNGKQSVHRNAKVSQKVKEVVQHRAMQYYGWTIEDFIRIFGKSYL